MMVKSITSFAAVGAVYASLVTGLAIRRSAVDFFDPAQGGGSMFDNATFGGEPLNVSSVYRLSSAFSDTVFGI